MADKVYVPKCSAKARTFDNGGSQIKLGFKVDELIAFAKQHGNQGGYLNLVVAERRTPGTYGDTHSVYLDDYVPRPRS